ncbi:MAG: TetR family transcriptional regulator [Pedobacter sp.]|nr:TetR family transcriptional regulator [Pedobacter sp.]
MESNQGAAASLTLADSQRDTARRILDAAYTLFLDFGLRRMTMEDVARKVGLSRITIYRYYRDKDALFHAVVHREIRRAIRHTRQQLLKLDDPHYLIEEGFVQTALQARQHPLIRRLLETEPEWLLPNLTMHSNSLFQIALSYCKHFIRETQTAGHYPELPVEVAAEILIRLLHSAVLMPGGLMSSDKEEDLRYVANLALAPIVYQLDR